MDLLFPRDERERLEFKDSALQIGFEELTAECAASLSLLQPHDRLSVLMMAWKKIGDHLTQNQYAPSVGNVVNWVGRHTLDLWFGRDWITCSSDNKTTLIEHMMKVYPAAYISMCPYSWPYMFSIYRDPWMVDYLNVNFQRMNDPELSEHLDAKDSDFIQQEGLSLIFLRIVNMFDFNMMKLVMHMCRRLLLAWHDATSTAHRSLRATANAAEYIEYVRHMYLITVNECSGMKDLHYVLECVQRNMHCNAIESDHLEKAAKILATGLLECKKTLIDFLIAFLTKIPERQFTNTFGNAVDRYKSFLIEYLLRKIHTRRAVGSVACILPADGFYENLVRMFIKKRESSDDLMKSTATVSERLFAGVHDLKALKFSYDHIKILTRAEWYTTKVTLLLGIIGEELNALEDCKYTDSHTADELIQKEQDLAIYYRDLSRLLIRTPVLEQEAWLTTFSLHPCKEYLDAVTKCGSRNLRAIKKQAIKLNVISEPKPIRPIDNELEHKLNPDKEKPSLHEAEKVPIPDEREELSCTTVSVASSETSCSVKDDTSTEKINISSKSKKLTAPSKKATKAITKTSSARVRTKPIERKTATVTTPIPKKPLPESRDKDTAEVLYAASAGAGDNIPLRTEHSIKYPEFALINSVTDTEDVIRYTDYDGEVLLQYRELTRILSKVRLQHCNYDDLLALLIAPRYKRLTWATCWKNLRKRCRGLLTKDKKKKQLVEQYMADANERLTHLQIDYEKYKNKPQIDYGTIEGGYECFDTDSGDEGGPNQVSIGSKCAAKVKRTKVKRSLHEQDDLSESELTSEPSLHSTTAGQDHIAPTVGVANEKSIDVQPKNESQPSTSRLRAIPSEETQQEKSRSEQTSKETPIISSSSDPVLPRVQVVLSGGADPAVQAAQSAQATSDGQSAPSVELDPSVKSAPTVQRAPSVQLAPSPKPALTVQGATSAESAPTVKAAPTVQEASTVQGASTVPGAPSVESASTVKAVAPAVKAAAPTVKAAAIIEAAPNAEVTPTAQPSSTKTTKTSRSSESSEEFNPRPIVAPKTYSRLRAIPRVKPVESISISADKPKSTSKVDPFPIKSTKQITAENEESPSEALKVTTAEETKSKETTQTPSNEISETKNDAPEASKADACTTKESLLKTVDLKESNPDDSKMAHHWPYSIPVDDPMMIDCGFQEPNNSAQMSHMLAAALSSAAAAQHRHQIPTMNSPPWAYVAQPLPALPPLQPMSIDEQTNRDWGRNANVTSNRELPGNLVSTTALAVSSILTNQQAQQANMGYFDPQHQMSGPMPQQAYANAEMMRATPLPAVYMTPDGGMPRGYHHVQAHSRMPPFAQSPGHQFRSQMPSMPPRPFSEFRGQTSQTPIQRLTPYIDPHCNMAFNSQAFVPHDMRQQEDNEYSQSAQSQHSNPNPNPNMRHPMCDLPADMMRMRKMQESVISQGPGMQQQESAGNDFTYSNSEPQRSVSRLPYTTVATPRPYCRPPPPYYGMAHTYTPLSMGYYVPRQQIPSFTNLPPRQLPFIDLNRNGREVRDGNGQSGSGLQAQCQRGAPQFTTWRWNPPEFNTVQIVKPSGTTRIVKMTVEMGQGIRRKVPPSRIDLLQPQGHDKFPNPRWRPVYSSVLKRKLLFVPTEAEVLSILSDYQGQQRNGKRRTCLYITGMAEDTQGEMIMDESVIINLTNPRYTSEGGNESTDEAEEMPNTLARQYYEHNQSKAEEPGKEAGVTYGFPSRPPVHFYTGIPTPAYHMSFVCPTVSPFDDLRPPAVTEEVLTLEPHLMYKLFMFLKDDDIVWEMFSLNRHSSPNSSDGDDANDENDDETEVFPPPTPRPTNMPPREPPQETKTVPTTTAQAAQSNKRPVKIEISSGSDEDRPKFSPKFPPEFSPDFSTEYPIEFPSECNNGYSGERMNTNNCYANGRPYPEQRYAPEICEPAGLFEDQTHDADNPDPPPPPNLYSQNTPAPAPANYCQANAVASSPIDLYLDESTSMYEWTQHSSGEDDSTAPEDAYANDEDYDGSSEQEVPSLFQRDFLDTKIKQRTALKRPATSDSDTDSEISVYRSGRYASKVYCDGHNSRVTSLKNRRWFPSTSLPQIPKQGANKNSIEEPAEDVVRVLPSMPNLEEDEMDDNSKAQHSPPRESPRYSPKYKQNIYRRKLLPEFQTSDEDDITTTSKAGPSGLQQPNHEPSTTPRRQGTRLKKKQPKYCPSRASQTELVTICENSCPAKISMAHRKKSSIGQRLTRYENRTARPRVSGASDTNIDQTTTTITTITTSTTTTTTTKITTTKMTINKQREKSLPRQMCQQSTSTFDRLDTRSSSSDQESDTPVLLEDSNSHGKIIPVRDHMTPCKASTDDIDDIGECLEHRIYVIRSLCERMLISQSYPTMTKLKFRLHLMVCRTRRLLFIAQYIKLRYCLLRNRAFMCLDDFQIAWVFETPVEDLPDYNCVLRVLHVFLRIASLSLSEAMNDECKFRLAKVLLGRVDTVSWLACDTFREFQVNAITGPRTSGITDKGALGAVGRETRKRPSDQRSLSNSESSMRSTPTKRVTRRHTSCEGGFNWSEASEEKENNQQPLENPNEVNEQVPSRAEATAVVGKSSLGDAEAPRDGNGEDEASRTQADGATVYGLKRAPIRRLLEMSMQSSSSCGADNGKSRKLSARAMIFQSVKRIRYETSVRYPAPGSIQPLTRRRARKPSNSSRRRIIQDQTRVEFFDKMPTLDKEKDQKPRCLWLQPTAYSMRRRNTSRERNSSSGKDRDCNKSEHELECPYNREQRDIVVDPLTGKIFSPGVRSIEGRSHPLTTQLSTERGFTPMASNRRRCSCHVMQISSNRGDLSNCELNPESCPYFRLEQLQQRLFPDLFERRVSSSDDSSMTSAKLLDMTSSSVLSEQQVVPSPSPSDCQTSTSFDLASRPKTARISAAIEDHPVTSESGGIDLDEDSNDILQIQDISSRTVPPAEHLKTTTDSLAKKNPLKKLKIAAELQRALYQHGSVGETLRFLRQMELVFKKYKEELKRLKRRSRRHRPAFHSEFGECVLYANESLDDNDKELKVARQEFQYRAKRYIDCKRMIGDNSHNAPILRHVRQYRSSNLCDVVDVIQESSADREIYSQDETEWSMDTRTIRPFGENDRVHTQNIFTNRETRFVVHFQLPFDETITSDEETESFMNESEEEDSSLEVSPPRSVQGIEWPSVRVELNAELSWFPYASLSDGFMSAEVSTDGCTDEENTPNEGNGNGQEPNGAGGRPQGSNASETQPNQENTTSSGDVPRDSASSQDPASSSMVPEVAAAGVADRRGNVEPTRKVTGEDKTKMPTESTGEQPSQGKSSNLDEVAPTDVVPVEPTECNESSERRNTANEKSPSDLEARPTEPNPSSNEQAAGNEPAEPMEIVTIELTDSDDNSTAGDMEPSSEHKAKVKTIPNEPNEPMDSAVINEDEVIVILDDNDEEATPSTAAPRPGQTSEPPPNTEPSPNGPWPGLFTVPMPSTSAPPIDVIPEFARLTPSVNADLVPWRIMLPIPHKSLQVKIVQKQRREQMRAREEILKKRAEEERIESNRRWIKEREEARRRPPLGPEDTICLSDDSSVGEVNTTSEPTATVAAHSIQIQDDDSQEATSSGLQVLPSREQPTASCSSHSASNEGTHAISDQVEVSESNIDAVAQVMSPSDAALIAVAVAAPSEQNIEAVASTSMEPLQRAIATRLTENVVEEPPRRITHIQRPPTEGGSNNESDELTFQRHMYEELTGRTLQQELNELGKVADQPTGSATAFQQPGEQAEQNLHSFFRTLGDNNISHDKSKNNSPETVRPAEVPTNPDYDDESSLFQFFNQIMGQSFQQNPGGQSHEQAQREQSTVEDDDDDFSLSALLSANDGPFSVEVAPDERLLIDAADGSVNIPDTFHLEQSEPPPPNPLPPNPPPPNPLAPKPSPPNPLSPNPLRPNLPPPNQLPSNLPPPNQLPMNLPPPNPLPLNPPPPNQLPMNLPPPNPSPPNPLPPNPLPLNPPPPNQLLTNLPPPNPLPPNRSPPNLLPSNPSPPNPLPPNPLPLNPPPPNQLPTNLPPPNPLPPNPPPSNPPVQHALKNICEYIGDALSDHMIQQIEILFRHKDVENAQAARPQHPPLNIVHQPVPEAENNPLPPEEASANPQIQHGLVGDELQGQEMPDKKENDADEEGDYDEEEDYESEEEHNNAKQEEGKCEERNKGEVKDKVDSEVESEDETEDESEDESEVESDDRSEDEATQEVQESSIDSTFPSQTTWRVINPIPQQQADSVPSSSQQWNQTKRTDVSQVTRLITRAPFPDPSYPGLRGNIVIANREQSQSWRVPFERHMNVRVPPGGHFDMILPSGSDFYTEDQSPAPMPVSRGNVQDYILVDPSTEAPHEMSVLPSTSGAAGHLVWPDGHTGVSSTSFGCRVDTEERASSTNEPSRHSVNQSAPSTSGYSANQFQRTSSLRERVDPLQQALGQNINRFAPGSNGRQQIVNRFASASNVSQRRQQATAPRSNVYPVQSVSAPGSNVYQLESVSVPGNNVYQLQSVSAPGSTVSRPQVLARPGQAVFTFQRVTAANICQPQPVSAQGVNAYQLRRALENYLIQLQREAASKQVASSSHRGSTSAQNMHQSQLSPGNPLQRMPTTAPEQNVIPIQRMPATGQSVNLLQRAPEQIANPLQQTPATGQSVNLLQRTQEGSGNLFQHINSPRIVPGTSVSQLQSAASNDNPIQSQSSQATALVAPNTEVAQPIDSLQFIPRHLLDHQYARFMFPTSSLPRPSSTPP